jgi:enoyl-CoA hydratase/carnithine racemase
LVVGDKRAREILFLNEPIPALKAQDWGLVNWVVPSVRKGEEWIEEASVDEIKKAQRGEDGYAIDLTRLDEFVDDVARRLLASFPECTRYTKQQVNYFKDQVWHSTVGHAQDWLSLHYACWEPVEGMQAFVEKRPARYEMLRTLAEEGRSSETPWGSPVGRCGACGAKNLPSYHEFCGACGQVLSEKKGVEEVSTG